MSNFYLNNFAINNVANYSEFKDGMLGLISINKHPNHTFHKHDSIYSLQILVDGLYTANMGKDEQEIYRFLEQQMPCDEIIETEADADSHCKSKINGHLGINFNAIPINTNKQITNNDDYKKWCFAFLSDIKFLLSQTPIPPANKKIHLSDHHG